MSTPSETITLLKESLPAFWINPTRNTSVVALEVGSALAPAGADTPPAARSISLADIEAAQSRFERFAPLLARLFPELAACGGAIESALSPLPAITAALGVADGGGRVFAKQDHALPVAGSIKARGGLHEVLEYAERVAVAHGLLPATAGEVDYVALASEGARAVFARHSVAVGSTGNLGLSIGVIASALGFRASVHMSADAKEWKKQRLRQRGVEVVEHAGDYAQAVAQGRAQAATDPLAHFVDDERSLSLFLGYAAAVFGLRRQLAEQGIAVDAEHPLFVYLPCGVGGAPAGIAFGIRQILGPHAHCFFAEPVQSPCVLVHMMDGADGPQGPHPTVYDYGLQNRTEADGLAVPQASRLASAAMRAVLGGIFTVEDAQLMRFVYQLEQAEGLRVEPSAAAGLAGPAMLLGTAEGRSYLRDWQLEDHLAQSTHLVWTTGGLFVPPAQYQQFWAIGRDLAAQQA
ncbi:D-serine ammonia-lyase [Acidovorax sp. CCYZU-2555]|uniref:D-serine ammonia-lyase n=1 Tax=Acidovorax sp. CCYZU-2555 TaxID=2835042 RepID=UPI001BCB04FF|nr:D-serine ammonia-lyase [Acidovorax sp. CCYZU-2555]MBS7780089.1 D-serine ammonia-lyase [Acidovorax sp. CCYZU-2555]